MTAPLANQVALVTGASSGIGEACALALAAAGAKVAVVARRARRLKTLVARIEAAGGRAIALPADATKADAAQAAVAEIIRTFGRLDILVNSAGVMQVANVENADLEQWRAVFDVNVYATLYTCAAATTQMLTQGNGTIINMGSLAVRTTTPVYNSYAASKRGLWALTDGMRKELGPKGIRVSMVVPGTVTTEIAEQITDPQHRDAIRQYLAQDGATKPDEIAKAVVYICAAPPEVNVSEMWIRATHDVAY